MLASPNRGAFQITQPPDSSNLSSPPLVLLGQFQVSGRANVDWTTTIKEQPVMDSITLDATQSSIERAPVIWLDDEDEDEDELPLLESTKKALGVMGYQIPTRGGGTMKPAKVTNTAEDTSGHTDETANAITDDEIDVEEEEQEEKTGFERFERALNVANLLQSALTDIRTMKRESKTGATPMKGKGKHKKLREKALEKQRETLQKRHEEEKNDGASEVAIAVNDSEDENADDSILILIRTINSLSILTPCIVQMWQHPRRKDAQLRIAGYAIKKKNKNTNCWMLFRNVCDITTIKQVGAIVDNLKSLYLVLGMSSPVTWQQQDESLQTQCEGTIRQLIESIGEHQTDNESTALPKWSRRMPFAAFHDSDAAMQQAAKLDVSLELARTAEEVEKRKKYESCVQSLSGHLESILKKRYNGARLSVYGSCLSDLSLGRGADVDMSLYIPSMAQDREDFQKGTTTVNHYQASVKKKVFETCRLLERRTHEFRDFTPVAGARVPVVKGTYSKARNPYSDDGSIDFDICFLNDIAVANSELLRQYSLVDPRAKHLMMSVKRWAKAQNISSSMDSCISSYAWMNLAVFYLQCLGLVPNLQCAVLQTKAGVERDALNHWHNVESLDTFFLKWEEASAHWEMPLELRNVSVSSLLYGFFRFYVTDFPSALYMISIKRGAECRFLKLETFSKSNHFFQIEDPFETFDCHKPHDLGMHANDHGASRIMDCFRLAVRGMEQALLSENDGEVSIDFLWSTPSPSNKKQPPSKKGQNRGNANTNRNGKSKSKKAKPTGQGSPPDEGRKASGGEQKRPAQQQSQVPADLGQKVTTRDNSGNKPNQNGQPKGKKQAGRNDGKGAAVSTDTSQQQRVSDKKHNGDSSKSNASRNGKNRGRNRNRSKKPKAQAAKDT